MSSTLKKRDVSAVASKAADVDEIQDAIDETWPPQGEPAQVIDATPTAATPERTASELPSFPESAWRGELKLLREAYTKNTEAPDSFIWAGGIVALSLTVGIRLSLRVPWGLEPLTVFALVVGKSARAKKATAARVVRALTAGDAGIEVWAGWPASPQALTETVIEAGTKSLLFELDEFSGLLKLMKTEIGGAFAQDINRMYDLKPLSRRKAGQKTLRTDAYFVSIIGANTRSLVHKDLDLEEAASGFAGRFMYFGGEPKPPMAWPEEPDGAKVRTVAARLAELSRELDDSRRTDTQVTMNDAARRVFTDWYNGEYGRVFQSEILENIAGRLQNHALRVAALFAILSGRGEVSPDDMRAGIELADYQRKMQAFIFTGFGSNREQRIEEELGGKIDELSAKGTVTRRAVQQALRSVDGVSVRASEFANVFRLYCSNRDIQVTDGGTLKFPVEPKC